MKTIYLYRTLCVVAACSAPYVRAQSTAPRQSFDAASIKPAKACSGGGVRPVPGTLSLPCITVRALIRAAYGTMNGPSALNTRRVDILGGGDWLDTDQYEIVAKAASGTPAAQMAGPMLQILLEDRFRLKLHTELRDVPVYSLSVGKTGPKLQATKEGSCVPIDLNSLPQRSAAPAATEAGRRYCGSSSMKGDGKYIIADWYGVDMNTFAGRILANYVDRPVVDKTGLSGLFDIHLQFARESVGGPTILNGEPSSETVASPDSSAVSIFTALQQQLGMKLSSDKGPIPVIVIDHIERPSDN